MRAPDMELPCCSADKLTWQEHYETIAPMFCKREMLFSGGGLIK